MIVLILGIQELSAILVSSVLHSYGMFSVMKLTEVQYGKACHLGGAVVSVVATRSKGRGLKPGQGDGF